jgi:hypothetical protein
MELVAKDSTTTCLEEGQPAYAQNANVDIASQRSHSSNGLVLGLAIGLGGGMVLMGFLGVYLVMRARRKRGPVLLEVSTPTPVLDVGSCLLRSVVMIDKASQTRKQPGLLLVVVTITHTCDESSSTSRQTCWSRGSFFMTNGRLHHILLSFFVS